MTRVWSGIGAVACLALVAGLLAGPAGAGGNVPPTITLTEVSQQPTPQSQTVSGTQCSAAGVGAVVTVRLKDPSGVIVETQTVTASSGQLPGTAGNWTLTLTIPANAAAGVWTIESFCGPITTELGKSAKVSRTGRVAIPAQGISFTYPLVTFTVVAPAPAPIVAQPTFTG